MARRTAAPRLLAVAALAALAGSLFGAPSAFFGPGGPEPVSSDARSYKLDNSVLNSPGAGVSYRNSKNEADMARDGAPWGAIVMGVEEDGWLKVGDKYLPMYSEGKQIVFPADNEDGFGDWKDEAWMRQQERLRARRARANPDFKMDNEELLMRQRKKAVWKAMSTRDSEGLLQADGRDLEDGKLITVTVQKPLGINFMEVNPSSPSGALIAAIADGMSAAKTDALDVGDVLVAVDGDEVYGQPMDEALEPIVKKSADEEMELVFFRANLD